MEANVVTVTTQLLIRLTNIDINKLLNLWLVQFDGLVAFIGRIGIAKGPTGNYFSDVEPRYKTTLFWLQGDLALEPFLAAGTDCCA